MGITKLMLLNYKTHDPPLQWQMVWKSYCRGWNSYLLIKLDGRNWFLHLLQALSRIVTEEMRYISSFIPSRVDYYWLSGISLDGQPSLRGAEFVVSNTLGGHITVRFQRLLPGLVWRSDHHPNGSRKGTSIAQSGIPRGVTELEKLQSKQ